MSGLPPIARPDNENLALERLRTVARKPGGRKLLTEQRTALQRQRDEYAEHSKQQLAALDELLARYAIVLDGKSELQA